MDAEDYQRHVAMNDICGRRGGLWGEGEWTNLEDQRWTKWLEKVSEGLVVLQKDQNGKVIGTVVDMRVKMCPKYLEEGPHYSLGSCPRWHICKRFLEGNCRGGCSRSHDFYDESNRDKIERFFLELFPNELIRRIVSYSLPQVCLLFLNGKCNFDGCPYLHICPSVVRKFNCECSPTHNNAGLSLHNKEVLQRYWLQARITDFALLNILVPVEQRNFKSSVTVIRIYCPNLKLPIFEDPKGALKIPNANAFVIDNLITRSTLGKDNAEAQRNRAINGHLPDHWSSMSSEKIYIRVKLEPSSKEFKIVERLFRHTMKDEDVIVEIKRLQNPFLWEKYCRKREYMERYRPLESANEKQLFHGTSKHSVGAICKQNFDWRVPIKNGNDYGRGIYFAKNASDSKYYAKPSEHHHRYMFLARVLVGTYTAGARSYCRPPPKYYVDPESDLYDSCVNNVKNPTVFVIFDNDQCYPEYIIKYFTLESADGIRRGASAFSALSSAVSRRLGRHIQRTKPAYPKLQRPPKPLPSPPRKDQRILAFVLSL